MKKLGLIIVLGIIFSLFLPSEKAFAQVYEEGVVEAVTETPAPMPDNVSTDSGQVNYELPYPGMLPDNPFYPLKMLRDKIVKSLISDPFERARFDILTAQKRMFAGKLLVGKKKHNLALDTIEKSSHYLDDTLHDIKLARRQNPKNIDISAFLDNFKTVTLKHAEILREIKPLVDKQNIRRVELQEARLSEILKNVEIQIRQR